MAEECKALRREGETQAATPESTSRPHGLARRALSMLRNAGVPATDVDEVVQPLSHMPRPEQVVWLQRRGILRGAS